MINYKLFQSLLQRKKGLMISGWFVIIMSFLLVVAIIVLVTLFDLNIRSSVVGDHLNMQYSTDSGRELYSILASGCDGLTDTEEYKGYNVETLISVYISGDLRVKQAMDTPLKECIADSLDLIAEVNEGVDKEGDPIKHYMYFYVIYGGDKYLEWRLPAVFVDQSEGMSYIPWNPEFVKLTTTANFDKIKIIIKKDFPFPFNPRYFAKHLNDRFSVQLPLADFGNMQFESAKAVLEEWSDEPWTTLTQAQQEYSEDYEN